MICVGGRKMDARTLIRRNNGSVPPSMSGGLLAFYNCNSCKMIHINVKRKLMIKGGCEINWK